VFTWVNQRQAQRALEGMPESVPSILNERQTCYAVCDLGGRIFRLDFALDFPTSSAFAGSGSAGSLILRLDCDNIPLPSQIRRGEKANTYVTTYSGFTATRSAAGSLAVRFALSSTSAWVQTDLRGSDKINGDSSVSFAGSWDGSSNKFSGSKLTLGVEVADASKPLGGLSKAGDKSVSTGICNVSGVDWNEGVLDGGVGKAAGKATGSTGICNVSGVDWNEGVLDGGVGKAAGKATGSGGSGEILYSSSVSLPRSSAFEGVSEPSTTCNNLISNTNTSMLQPGTKTYILVSYLSALTYWLLLFACEWIPTLSLRLWTSAYHSH